MEIKHCNYNQLLSELFVDWIDSYPAEKRYLFCKDGIMLKNDSTINVNHLWEQSKRRVAFLLKDCPDGWGYDTREMLLDTHEKGKKNRELKVPFLKNLAKLLYGLLEMSPEDVNIPFNNQYVDKRMHEVIDYWNTKPFAYIESKKLAGGPRVKEKEIIDALDRDELFFKKELDILSPNIILCCNETGDSIFNFITQKYFMGKEPQKIGGEYIVDGKVIKNMKTCLWYYPVDNVVVIKAFHPSGGKPWEVLEKVFSPFRSFIRDINPSF